MSGSPLILRCTVKFLKTAGMKPTPIESTLDHNREWYANLVWFDRRKCVLLTHASTFFSIFVADVRKRDLTPVGAFVADHVKAALASEGLPAATFGVLDASEVQVAKTASRVVLGVMNDQAWQIENQLASEGGLARTDIASLNHWLHRSINSPNGYQHPIDLARTLAGHRLRLVRPDSLGNPG